ncbi:MAG: site-specific DNA-methyltransferase [Deltaproteobacteria bacterium]|nr:MAG: site-specific DNA-methyltransferase [Deltaproteobacteria bacterium]
MSQAAALRPNPQALRDNNKLRAEDHSVHDWYRFVLSFPPHLVRSYLERFGITESAIVLDPFCGTGTTLVECKKLGIPSVGIEANPIPCFATRVKVNWEADPGALLKHAKGIAASACKRLALDGLEEYQNMPLFRAGKPKMNPLSLRRLPHEAEALLLTNSISPVPLHRVLVLLESIQEFRHDVLTRYERLALAKALVFEISNLEFGPEVGVGPPKSDAPAVTFWLDAIQAITDDLRTVRHRNLTSATVHRADSRNILSVLQPNSIDAVITSPPYPNEKDYTRTTRLESVLLGFIRNKQDLRALKQDLVRSNTRGVYKSDRDDVLVSDHEEIQSIAEAIEKRRIELGKTSGFERLYARVTRLYFGGMAKHLSDLRTVLRPGAQLAYVVGDQASYLRVMIRTGQLLADIADSLGYEVTGIDLFRTRLATATKEQLREEVVLLRWRGAKNRSRTMLMNEKNLYSAIIEKIFQSKFKKGMRELDFDREELLLVAKELGLKEPKNLGDLIYTFRYRAGLPQSIKKHAGEAETWIIRPAGRGKYRFVLIPDKPIAPNENLAITKVPDATPGVVAKYALSDEQALLAKLRYNRLVDIFTGVACYSLQNHLRTSVPNMGQAETDEIYVGLDKKGAHYVFPVQAKGGSDKLNIVQIEQDLAVCAHKFPSLICRPIGAQFMQGGVIALFEFEEGEEGLGIAAEKHYKLVPPDEVTDEDLRLYSTRGSQ